MVQGGGAAWHARIQNAKKTQSMHTAPSASICLPLYAATSGVYVSRVCVCARAPHMCAHALSSHPPLHHQTNQQDQKARPAGEGVESGVPCAVDLWGGARDR